MKEKILELRTPGKIYTNSSSDKFILNIEFGMAKKDSDDKSDNVKRGNNYKFFDKRQWIGKAKPGYLNVTNPITKEKSVDIDPERFPLLQKAIKTILSGTHTPMETLQILNNEWGFRTKPTLKMGNKPLTHSAFYKLLGDSFIYGLMKRKEGEIMGSHQPMISEEEYNKLQIILGRKGKPHKNAHEFPFKGLLRCGECGGSVTCEEKWQIICPTCRTKFHRGRHTNSCPHCHCLIEEMVKPKILHYVFYHCTKRVHKNCTQGSITLDRLTHMIDEELSKFEISEKLKDWAITHLNELHDCEVDERESIRHRLEKAKTDCIKSLDGLVKLKISANNSDGHILSDEEYCRQRSALQLEKESIERQLGNINTRMDNWHELSIKTFNFACYARYWFANGDIQTKTRILASLGSNLKILNKSLQVEGESAYFLIKKGKKEIKEKLARLEPEKTIDLSSINYLPETLKTSWLPDKDSNLENLLQREA